jgi:N-carbamoylputrescine amidase
MAEQETRTIRVAAVQMESENGRVEVNLERATRFVDQAAQKGAGLIILPEFMPTGYVYTTAIWEGAETKQGPTVVWLRENAKRLGVWIGTSFLEAEGEHFFNTFVLTGPDGQEAGRVRKQTSALFEAFFVKGDAGSHVIHTDFGKVGVGICYENQLAYIPSMMCEHAVDLLLMPHSAPTPSTSVLVSRKNADDFNRGLKELAPHYARVLGVPAVMINKSGPWQTPVPGLPFLKQDSAFPGLSTICDSDGTVKGQLGSEEGLIVEDVTLDPSRKTGRMPPCYGRWAVKNRIPIPAPQVIEALGKTWYALSGERKKRARQISAAGPR